MRFPLRRPHPAAVLGLVLGLGIAIGYGTHALVDRWQAGAEPAVAERVLTAAPSSAQPTPVTAVVPTARPTLTAQPTAIPQDVVVEVTESELEGQLAALIVGQSLGTTPIGDATIQTVSVRLRDKQIEVGGGARAGFLQAPFLAAGTIVPDGDGKPVVQVNQANIGGVDLPDGARAALAESLQERVDGLLGDSGVKIRTIDIADGKMRVVGRPGS